MKVCVSGYYGSENVGDELLLQAVIAGVCRELGKDTEFFALGARPGAISTLHGIGKVAPNTGWQNASQIIRCPKASPVALDMLRECDLYIMGGGGLFGHDCVYTSDEVLFCHRHRIPVVALGVGGDPFTKNLRPIFEQYFERVTAVTTRDHWSYSNLSNVIDVKKTKLLECADPVFTLDTQAKGRSRNRILLVMSTPLRWGSTSVRSKMISTWSQTLSRVASECGVEIALYPFSPNCPWHDDRDPALAFSKASESPIQIIDSSEIPFMQVAEEMSDCLAVVGDRYHALVLSALNGNPFMGIAHDTKQRNVSAQLNQPWLYPDSKDGEHYIEASFRDLIQNLSRHRSKLLQALPAVRELSDRSFKLLRSL